MGNPVENRLNDRGSPAYSLLAEREGVRRPTVSAVIPAHNSARTIEAAIGSVLAQSVPVDEIIVVDDGSTDETVALAEAMGPNVRVVRQRRMGPSGARNTGLGIARCEWVGFLDSDDLWHPEKLAEQLPVVLDRPNAAIVAADWSLRLDAPKPSKVRVRRLRTADFLVFNRLQTSTVLMRRSVALALSGFDSRLDGAEDWDLWIRASHVGEVWKLNCPLVQYAIRPDGYSRDLFRVYRAATELLERELDSRTPGVRALHAWHYLQFAEGFWRAGLSEEMHECLRRMRALALLPFVPIALMRYLPDYGARRLARRVLPRFGMT